LKIQRAGMMLRGTDLPVKQVARILGFESVYHFSTLFKKKIGVSPSRWRALGIESNAATAFEGSWV
jgi:AraC-like DNA-binding protein